jgi:DNA-binding MarR family transcriptional regulator
MSELVEIFSELVRFETELWNGVDHRLRADVGLALNRFEPMRVIAAHGSCRVLDVAAALAIGISGTSKLIDRIESDGLCTRRVNPDDRRSAFVSLTPAGDRLLARAEATFEAELELRLGAVLAPTEREALAGMLGRLRARA